MGKVNNKYADTYIIYTYIYYIMNMIYNVQFIILLYHYIIYYIIHLWIIILIILLIHFFIKIITYILFSKW